MNHKAREIKNKYNPDDGDISVGRNGQFVQVTWAERALLDMIEAQQGRIVELEKKFARLEHEQKISRAAMPFGGV